MATWVSGLAAVTLFVEDLDAARRFYQDVFELPVHYEDSSSAVFMFGETMINLLQAEEAHELIAPAAVAPPESGPPVPVHHCRRRRRCDVQSAGREGSPAPQRADGPAVGNTHSQLPGPWWPHLGDRALAAYRARPSAMTAQSPTMFRGYQAPAGSPSSAGSPSPAGSSSAGGLVRSCGSS
jgi:catechol 2,3-dioxygenase-like lactoylglutathione lyase family enzyme